MRRILVASLVVMVSACTGGSSSRAAEQLAALQKKKEADARAKKEKEEQLEALPMDVIKLDPPFDDTQAMVLLPDGPCPEGFWALFGGEAPGENADEKKANAARRKALAAEVKSKTYVVKLRGPTQVMLSPYDAPNGKFTIDVVGTIDCTDPLGRIAIAWTDAKAGDPGSSAVHSDAEVTQNLWTAAPARFELGMTSMTDAKAFADSNRFGLSARVGFSLGKVEVDRKLKKMTKVTEKAQGETLSFGGGTEDWGAGRLVHAEHPAIRVATEREKKMLFEKRQ